MSMAVHDQETNDLFSSPFFRWVAIGPLFIFMFVGRYIMRFETRMAPGSLSNTSNAITSTISLLAWDSFFGCIPIFPALALGWAFTYLVLVVTNRRWNF